MNETVGKENFKYLRKWRLPNPSIVKIKEVDHSVDLKEISNPSNLKVAELKTGATSRSKSSSITLKEIMGKKWKRKKTKEKKAMVLIVLL